MRPQESRTRGAVKAFSRYDALAMQEPLLAAPPTMVDPVNGTRVWLFDEPATLVDQTLGPLTASVARYLTVSVESVIQERWIRGGKKVTFIHDWRESRDYEAEGRNLMIKWGKDSLAHAQRVWVQIGSDATPFLRIATSTGISALKFVRMPIDLVNDLGPHLKDLLPLRPVALGR